MLIINFKQVQNTIGYNFKNEYLLQQAFVRRTYSQEKGGENNEVLEFIGDKALDFAVVIMMMKRFGEIITDYKMDNLRYFKTKIGEGKFTNIKKMLVEKKALSKCMERLGFHNQLIMGKGDIRQCVANQDSVKEDLFEAIIGAVAVDSNYDLNAITKVVDAMLDLDTFFGDKSFDVDFDFNYIGWLQEWSQGMGLGLPNYEITQISDKFMCVVTIISDDKCIVKENGVGISKSKARYAAAQKAYEYITSKFCIKSEYESVVDEVTLKDSTRKLNELYQKGFIGKPKFECSHNYNGCGGSEWYCVMKIDGLQKVFSAKGGSKKGCQRIAAYNYLNFLKEQEKNNL